MNSLKIASAQFENRSGDKTYNLEVIRDLSLRASALGADVIAFHECSITGYTFARNLSRDQLSELAEPIPAGPSMVTLTRIAAEAGIAILAGLFEKDAEG